MLVLCVRASGRLGLAACFGLVGGPERSCSRFNPLWRCDNDSYAFMAFDFTNKECGVFFSPFKIKVYNSTCMSLLSLDLNIYLIINLQRSPPPAVNELHRLGQKACIEYLRP